MIQKQEKINRNIMSDWLQLLEHKMKNNTLVKCLLLAAFLSGLYEQNFPLVGFLSNPHPLQNNSSQIHFPIIINNLISGCFGQKGYVANYGDDAEYCGFNSSLPCRTLQHLVNRSDTYEAIYILPDSSQSVYDPGGDVLYYEPKSTLRLDGRLGK